MNVAIAIFKDCVSPRLDIADSLFLYQLENGHVSHKKRLMLVDTQHNQMSILLQKKQVSMVICGSCPQLLYSMLCCQGIRVVPVVEGVPDQVEKQLLAGTLDHIAICNPGRRCKGVNKNKCTCKKTNFGSTIKIMEEF